MILISTSKGEIKLQLDEKATPKTTANFLKYLNEGFYDNTIFHRVIAGFMIQGGGMDENMATKKTHTPVQNEAAKGKANKRGTIAMARTNDPHSASSQFFINLVDNDFLNYKNDSQYGYCVFGEVVQGMDVVDAIGKTETTAKAGHSDVPSEPIFINSVKIIAD